MQAMVIFRAHFVRHATSDFGVATQVHVCTWLASQSTELPGFQKWMITSLAAMTAQLLVGAMAALALPLKASALSDL